MGLLHLAAYAALGTAAGLAIGCVGIGGVILVPALVYVAAVPLPTAIAAALCAFLVSGVVGLCAFARTGTIQWRTVAWLCVGAAPAAFAGARLVSIVSETLIELAIGVLTAAAGVHALAAPRGAERARERALSVPASTATGAATGVASAITGTGGPLVLVPILVWLKVPILAAIGSAQAIQLPIAAAAPLSNVLVVVGGAPLLRLALAAAARAP